MGLLQTPAADPIIFFMGGMRMKEKARIFREEHGDIVKIFSTVFVFGIFYCIFTLLTDIGIPCPIYTVTGLSCPGCGISRFFLCLVRLDFSRAVSNNVAVAFFLPLWLIIGIIEFFANPPWLAKGSVVGRCLVYGTLITMILFGILRNLPGFEFLLPK